MLHASVSKIKGGTNDSKTLHSSQNDSSLFKNSYNAIANDTTRKEEKEKEMSENRLNIKKGSLRSMLKIADKITKRMVSYYYDLFASLSSLSALAIASG